MAFSASTVSRTGANNGAADKRELYLKIFTGEVMSAFEETLVTADKHMVRNIANGKTAQFMAFGKAASTYFSVGDVLDGGTPIKQSERTISIDDMLIAHCFVANIDEAMEHYDSRSEYAKALGRALGLKFDENVLRNMALAARAAATVTGLSGGTELIDADALTNPTSLIQSAFDAAATLDGKDVPSEDRFIFVKPTQYYQLVNSDSKLIDVDYNPGVTNGSVAEGTVRRIAGFKIVKVNHLPQADDSANTGIPAGYRANFSNVGAIAVHKSAVGTVKLIDMAFETDYDIEKQGNWLVAKYALGHGILRPESAVNIVTTATL